ncbi:MAG TPA: prepilin-type N-terminal cleavage/methylation domain-containing protein [Verrucomicrobiae bacterium]|jgi:prepilin-type N-terminal cleavage/methylation domain-containing protein
MKLSSNIPRRGFTLLEVMFAVMAFCTASFAILALVSQSLEEARRLQRPMVDAGEVAAAVYATTNKIVEGHDEGNLSDILGDDYKNYDWAADKYEVDSNLLFQVNITVTRQDTAAVVSHESYVFYKPDSPAGSLDGATVAR